MAATNPLIQGYGKRSISENISEMMHGGYSQDRAIAAALRTARKVFRKRFPGKPLPERLKKPNPKEFKTREIRKAVSLYRKFTGMAPKFIRKVRVPDRPSTLLVIGNCDGILYTTIRDGEKEEYIHKFSKGSRPLLCSSPDGKQLFLLGGSFDFTKDGIVDRKQSNPSRRRRVYFGPERYAKGNLKEGETFSFSRYAHDISDDPWDVGICEFIGWRGNRALFRDTGKSRITFTLTPNEAAKMLFIYGKR